MSLNNEECEIYRRTIRKYIEKELAPQLDEWEEKGEIPKAVWKKLGEQGYLCTWLEEGYGGPGAGFEFACITLEEMTRMGFGEGMAVHSDIASPYIYSYGTEEQKQKWLPKLASGDMVIGIAMTEPNTGSDLAAIKTRAVKDGDEYVINGQKVFITNGIICDLVLVACKTDSQAPGSNGISLIVVEAGTSGFIKSRKLKKLGNHCHDHAELFFEDCRVPAANLIGEENKAFKYLMAKLQQERLVSALMSQSIAERTLEDAIEYAKIRTAFGKPIIKFQHSAFKIAEMATEIQLGRTFINDLIENHIQGKDVTLQVSMAKYWICEMANRVVYHCLQLHGAYGYSEEYPIARTYRNVRAHTIAAGTSEIMKVIIAQKMGL